jgi:hypothetical protein
LPWILGEVGYDLTEDDLESAEAWRRSQGDLSYKLYRLEKFEYDAVFLWYASYPEIGDATSLFFRGEPGEALSTARKLLRANPAAATQLRGPTGSR